MIAERLILLPFIKYILIFVVYPYICLVLADHPSRLPLMVISDQLLLPILIGLYQRRTYLFSEVLSCSISSFILIFVANVVWHVKNLIIASSGGATIKLGEGGNWRAKECFGRTNCFSGTCCIFLMTANFTTSRPLNGFIKRLLYIYDSFTVS